MAQEARPLDTTNMPELSQLVREVARTGQPRLLRADGDAALLSPAAKPHRGRKSVTQGDFEAAMNATFGAWNDQIDAEEFKRQRAELQEHDREPRSL